MRIIRRAGALGAVAASLAVAAPAHAGTLSVDYGKGALAYQAAAGESNNVAISVQASTYQIEDQAVPQFSLVQTGAGPACALIKPWDIRCPAPRLKSVAVALGDGADSFSGGGIALPTVVTGGPGQKRIATGSGDDQINVRNGSADSVSCGAGVDVVIGDAQDSVNGDCEKVDLAPTPGPIAPAGSGNSGQGGTGSPGGDAGSGASGGGDLGAGGGNVFTTPLGLSVAATAITLPRPDTAIVPLGCAATARDGCRGDIDIELPPAPASKHVPLGRVIAARGHYLAQQRARGRTVGRRSFKLAAGESADVAVRILCRGHYQLASKRHRTRAVMRITERDSAGKVIESQSRMVVLRATNKWSRIHRRSR